MIFGHVVQQLPVEHLAADRTPALVLAFVSQILHAGGDEAVRAQQMPFEALISEKSELTLLAVERRPVVNHLGVDLHFVNELHVIPELVEVTDVAITDFANDKIVLATAGHRSPGFEAADRGH